MKRSVLQMLRWNRTFCNVTLIIGVIAVFWQIMSGVFSTGF